MKALQHRVVKGAPGSHCGAYAKKFTVRCKAAAETTEALDAQTSSTPAPQWLPEQAQPVLSFLDSRSFKLADSQLYKNYVQQYVENEWVVKSLGWKEIPELVNGRAAMLGFLAAAGAEVCGAGSFLSQLSQSPQPVLVVLALTVAASIIPIYKGTQGEYLASLRDTYSVPQGIFTENMERIHGRLAMLGLGGLVLVELLSGKALL